MTTTADPIHGDRRNENRETRTVDYYCRHHGWVTVDQVPLRFPHRDCIPVIDTTDAAETLLQQLRARDENAWVSVFWDRGWGDAGTVTEISIIADGDGQWPYAYLTESVYERLVVSGVVAPNSLQTYKARKIHDYEPEGAK